MGGWKQLLCLQNEKNISNICGNKKFVEIGIIFGFIITQNTKF